MLVDMHLHECTYSTDSFLHLEEIVSIARQKGLDAICITDHDSMGLRERAEAYSREIGYPIFVGVEFFSLWGDITAWGIDGIPDQRVSAQDFIDLVREKDGFCVSCHPFRSNNRGLREHLRDVHGLDGVEVLNGSTPLEENRTALRFCRELGLKAIGASDAHVPEQVGKYVTWLPETVTTLPDFVTALHTLETRPAIWTGSGYDVVTEFWDEFSAGWGIMLRPLFYIPLCHIRYSCRKAVVIFHKNPFFRVKRFSEFGEVEN